MCRLAAYNGRPLPLSALPHEPSHSLLVQSYRPMQMREALLNADGVGVAWYPDDGDPTPCRYRSAGPIWSDENLQALAPRVRSSMLLAIVRSATPGLAVGPASTPPYLRGRISFMHNGYLENFRTRFMRAVRDELTDAGHEVVLGGTDTEHVFGLFLDALSDDESSTGALVSSMRSIIALLTVLASRGNARAVLNLAASNGRALVATRYSSSGPTATLFVADHVQGYDEGIVISSEPLTRDPAWREVPDDSLLVVEEGRLHVEGLR